MRLLIAGIFLFAGGAIKIPRKKNPYMGFNLIYMVFILTENYRYCHNHCFNVPLDNIYSKERK